MRAWTKFKIFTFTPFRIFKSIFNFAFPQVITLKCRACGELRDIDKYLYIAREEALRKNEELNPYLDIECSYCQEKKFVISRRKSRRIKFFSVITTFIRKTIEKTWNVVIIILGNLLAEIWKLIVKFWRDDLYIYLKTIISFFGISVGILILSHLLGLEIKVASALTFVFFVVNVIKNIINRRN